MKRLGSFTVIELLVVMILSTIIMLFALWIYSSSFKIYNNINKRLANSNHYYGYITRMREDIDKADFIQYTNREYKLYLNDSVLCSYYLDNDYIVRYCIEKLDTLNTSISNIDTSCIMSQKGDIFIKSLAFDLQINSNKVNVYMHKDYYSAFLFNITNLQ